MANIIRQLAYARESSHFKVEQASVLALQALLPGSHSTGAGARLRLPLCPVQEADLQRHAQRLARQGKIKEIAGAYLRPRRELTFEESLQTYEARTDSMQILQLRPAWAWWSGLAPSAAQVLAEILQQGARIDDPDAAARQEFVRWGRAQRARCVHSLHSEPAAAWTSSSSLLVSCSGAGICSCAPCPCACAPPGNVASLTPCTLEHLGRSKRFDQRV
jgi:hypothetical protein